MGTMPTSLDAISERVVAIQTVGRGPAGEATSAAESITMHQLIMN